MTRMHVTDADIVAFLDDALPPDDQARIAIAAAESPEVANRIEAMSMDRDQLSGAFEDLLAAAPAIPVTAPAANLPNRPSRWLQAAAAAAILAIGIAIGTQLPRSTTPDWHMAVADYQVLYATATLTGMELTQDQRWGSLARTSQTLGLELTQEDVSLPGLDFRRAQILNHNGKPLAQLAFLDPDGNAIAFCFTRTDGPDQQARTTRLSGLPTMTWQKDGMGFILIGGSDLAPLEQWHDTLNARIGT